MREFNPADNYKSLLKQARAMHTIIQCKEKENNYLSKARYDHSAERVAHLEAMIESEKEMNHILSNERGSGWNRIDTMLPDIDQVVWLYDGKMVWVGSRSYMDSEYWFWGNSYGSFWHNGENWDADCEVDDDYKPTHWKPLPILPEESI